MSIPLFTADSAAYFGRTHGHNARTRRSVGEPVVRAQARTPGALSTGRPHSFRPLWGATSSVAFECSGPFCVCRGDEDCNDMFSTDVCGPVAECNYNTGVCICLRW